VPLIVVVLELAPFLLGSIFVGLAQGAEYNSSCHRRLGEKNFAGVNDPLTGHQQTMFLFI